MTMKAVTAVVASKLLLIYEGVGSIDSVLIHQLMTLPRTVLRTITFSSTTNQIQFNTLLKWTSTLNSELKKREKKNLGVIAVEVER